MLNRCYLLSFYDKGHIVKHRFLNILLIRDLILCKPLHPLLHLRVASLAHCVRGLHNFEIFSLFIAISY